MINLLQLPRITQMILLYSMLILGNNCSSKENKETVIKEERNLAEEVEHRDSIPLNDPANVIIKKEDLKTEINSFIDSLYYRRDTLKEIKGISLEILKNTEDDLAIKLINANPGCSNYLLGITDYKYRNMVIYLLSDNVGVNDDFFKLKYKAMCEKLEDRTTVINKAHLIPFYEIMITYTQKILYYQKKDDEYVLTYIFYNDSDVPE